MQIEFDPVKNKRNVALRGLSFEQVTAFEFSSAIFATDDRHDYGETRLRALGLFQGRVHVLVLIEIADGIRVISFRKANEREVKQYEKASQS